MATGYQIESGSCFGRGFVTQDANGILAKFYTWVTKSLASGGPAWFIIDDHSSDLPDPYIVVCDIAQPVVNDIVTGKTGGPPKFVKIGMVASLGQKIYVQYYCWWNSSTHVGQGLFSGFYVATVDSGSFAYDFRGGDVCMIIQSRIGTSWSTTFIDEWVGDPLLVEDATHVDILQAGVQAGANVTLQLTTASRFTQGNHYYIVDFSAAHTWANYVKCTNVDLQNNQITVGYLNQNFPSGSVIGAYVHRFVASGAPTNSTNVGFSNRLPNIPYYSTLSDGSYGNQYSVMWDQINYYPNCINGDVRGDYLRYAMLQMAPNDDGLFAVMQLLLIELYDYNSEWHFANRAYGVPKSVWACTLNPMGVNGQTMAPGLDGKIIGGKNWLYFQPTHPMMGTNDGDIAALFLDTPSL